MNQSREHSKFENMEKRHERTRIILHPIAIVALSEKPKHTYTSTRAHAKSRKIKNIELVARHRKYSTTMFGSLTSDAMSMLQLPQTIHRLPCVSHRFRIFVLFASFSFSVRLHFHSLAYKFTVIFPDPLTHLRDAHINTDAYIDTFLLFSVSCPHSARRSIKSFGHFNHNFCVFSLLCVHVVTVCFFNFSLGHSNGSFVRARAK